MSNIIATSARGAVRHAQRATRHQRILHSSVSRQPTYACPPSIRHGCLQQTATLPEKYSQSQNPNRIRRLAWLVMAAASVAGLSVYSLNEQLYQDESLPKLPSSPRRRQLYKENSKLETDYVIVQRIAYGGFGKVLAGRHIRSGTAVAIKQMPKKKVSRRKFKEEVDILTDVGGKRNIIELRDAFETKDHWVIVTELARGGELFDRLVEKGAYSEGEARDFMREISKAVSYLHENNVVHGDLKPENVVLSAKDRPTSIRLVDFGMSFRFTAQQGKVCKDGQQGSGTLGYSSPELLTGGKVGAPTDIWSLGIILYIVLTGIHPVYRSEEPPDSEVVNRILEGKFDFSSPSLWGSISSEAKDLVQKMLSCDPAQRPTAEGLMAHPWFQVDDASLSKQPLSSTADHLAQYQRGKRRLEATVWAVLLDAEGDACPEKSWLTDLLDGKIEDDVDLVLDAFDKDRKGYIDRNDICRVLKSIGEDYLEPEIEDILHVVDSGECKPEHLQYSDIVKVMKNIRRGTYKMGQVIIEEGERSEKLYKLLDGEVEVSLNGVVVDRIKAGDCFGVHELLRADGDVHKRFCTYRCVSGTCRALELTKREVDMVTDVLEVADRKLKRKAREEMKKMVLDYVTRLPEDKENVRVRKFSSGQLVFGEGNKDDLLYVVRDGEIEIVKTLPDGKKVTVERIGKGGCFDPQLCLATSAKCISPASVVEVAGRSVRKFLRECDLLMQSLSDDREEWSFEHQQILGRATSAQ